MARIDFSLYSNQNPLPAPFIQVTGADPIEVVSGIAKATDDTFNNTMIFPVASWRSDVVVDGVGHAGGPIICASIGGGDGYTFSENTDGTQLYLYRYDVLLDDTTSSPVLPIVAGDTKSIRREDDEIVCYVKKAAGGDFVEVFRFEDTTYMTGMCAIFLGLTTSGFRSWTDGNAVSVAYQPVAVTTSPQSIDVPAIAKAALFSWAYFAEEFGDPPYGLDSATLDSNPADVAGELGATGSVPPYLSGSGLSIFYDPASGSKSFAHAFHGTTGEGPHREMTFLTADAAVRIRGSVQVDQQELTDPCSVTLNALTVGDLVIALDFGYTELPSLPSGWFNLKSGSVTQDFTLYWRLRAIYSTGSSLTVTTSGTPGYSGLAAAAFYEEDGSVTQTGLTYVGNTTSEVGVSVEVPPDADCCIVHMNNYVGVVGAGSGNASKLAFDGAGVDFTWIGNALFGVNEPEGSAYLMTASSPNWPGAGSKTLTLACGSYSEGLGYCITFWKNVDQTSPIVDVAEMFDTNVFPFTSDALTGVGADDMSFLQVDGYNNDNPNMAPSGSGQTSIASTVNVNGTAMGVAAKRGASTLQCTFTDYIGPVAFALRAATPSSGPEIDSVSGDDVVLVYETDVLIAGSGFGASQGAGSVKITQGTVEKPQPDIGAWADDEVEFDLRFDQ